jgi:cytidyltransferase-like protein
MEKNKIVFTCGVYDLFHIGHLRLLQRAKAEGFDLYVGIVRDSAVKALKGLNRPIMDEESRYLLINSLEFVNGCFFQDTFDPSFNLSVLKYTYYEDDIIFVKGEDQDHISEDFAKKFDIKIVKLPRTPGVSTSDLIKRIKIC